MSAAASPAAALASFPAGRRSTDSAFSRSWRGLMTARVVLAAVLPLLLAGLDLLGLASNVNRWLFGLCGAYLAAALSVRIFTRPQPPGRAFDPQWVFSIGVDLVAFSTLQFVQAGGINFLPLFALPVLMAAVLGSGLLALGTAAGVTLLLLGDAWLQSMHLPPGTAEMPGRFLQAGLTGTGYFALAMLVTQLSVRLTREEAAARQGQQAARMQAEVNELVIESLADGVLVVDAHCQVQAVNPAARNQLGLAPLKPPFDLTREPDWAPLVSLARETFAQRHAQRVETALGARHVQVRSRLTALHDPQAESLCVMFVEDLREIEARLRTEKLAAMGRMSAAVAHEIRNPLAAIAQANALLDEDLEDPALRQLSALVRKNTQRLTQVVDEILDISRAGHQRPSMAAVLALDAAVATACADWAAQTSSTSRLHLGLAAPLAQVRFEADHLRRVLVNLLDNAWRYAGHQPDSIRVATRVEGATASLRVWSDGAPLDPQVQLRLFEPFFSSESRSSGLGLFICRELCERHGATLRYERTRAATGSQPREGNDFIVTFAEGALPLADASSFDTMVA